MDGGCHGRLARWKLNWWLGTNQERWLFSTQADHAAVANGGRRGMSQPQRPNNKHGHGASHPGSFHNCCQFCSQFGCVLFQVLHIPRRSLTCEAVSCAFQKLVAITSVGHWSRQLRHPVVPLHYAVQPGSTLAIARPLGKLIIIRPSPRLRRHCCPLARPLAHSSSQLLPQPPCVYS